MEQEPRKLKRVVVKEELVALTKKVNHAIVLNQMIYWSERTKDAKQFFEEEYKRNRQVVEGTETEEEMIETLDSGWIYKTSDQMIDETMLEVSRKTMNRIFDNLVENDWIQRRRNPKYKWDQTWQYRVNLNKIQQDLHNIGYALEGYSLLSSSTFENTNDLSNGQNDHWNGQGEKVVLSNGQNDHWNGQHDLSSGQHDQAIPEITTDTSFIDYDNKENEKEEENNKQEMNLAFDILKDFLKNKGIDQNTINQTITELMDRNIDIFLMKDVEKQFEHMMHKLNKGEVDNHNGFASYFAYGLEMRITQSDASRNYQLEKLQEYENDRKQKKERDKSVYYNWLEE